MKRYTIVGKKVYCTYPSFSILFSTQCATIKRKFPTCNFSFRKEKKEPACNTLGFLGYCPRHWFLSPLTWISGTHYISGGMDENKGEPFSLVWEQKNYSNTDRQQGDLQNYGSQNQDCNMEHMKGWRGAPK